MNIRTAQAKDSKAINTLLVQLGYPGSDADEISRRIQGYEREDYKLYVAEEDDLVIGFISLHCYGILHSESKIGRITALCVHDQHRSKGIGKLLLKEGEQYFIRSGCAKFEVTSNMRRADAHGFYLSQGYIEDSRKFVKYL